MSALLFRAAPRALPLALISFALSLPASAQPGLSLDDTLRLAHDRSRQITALQAGARASRDMASAAQHLPDPVFKAGINNVPIDGPQRYTLTRDFMTARSLGVMQEFTGAGKRQARAARFESQARSDDAERDMAWAALRQDAARAWLSRHFLERQRDLLQAQRRETALQIEAAEAAYRGGRGSQADVFASRSAVAMIDDRLKQTDWQVSEAQTRLARWVGTDAARPLAAPPALEQLPLDLAQLETQLARHPQLTLLEQQQAVARADADMARANRHADWSVELMFSQRGPAFSNMMSLNLAIPLQWDQARRQDREVAARLARVEQAGALRDDAQAEVTARVRTDLLQWQNLRDRLAHYDTQLLPLAAERTRAALAAYRGGSVALPVVLDARQADISTGLERLRLETEAAGLWANLTYLLAPELAATPTPSTARLPPQAAATASTGNLERPAAPLVSTTATALSASHKDSTP